MTTSIEIIPAHEVPADPAAFAPVGLGSAGFVPDPDNLHHLIWMWVSAVVANGSSLRTSVTSGLSMVRAVAAIQFTDADGIHHPPLATLPPAKDPVHALRKLGLDGPDIDAACLVATASFGTRAVLPPDLVTAVVPLDYWPVLARLVHDGPERLWERFSRAMALEAARTTKRKDRRRSAEASPRLSASALKGRQASFRSIIRPLLNLKKSGLDSTWLHGWDTTLPDPISMKTLNPDPFRADRTAPDLLAVRRAWRRLDETAQKRLSTKRGRASSRTLLRDRALLAIVLGTGMRIDAVARLRICDFNPAHTFKVSGEVGPALRVSPRKGRSDTVWKAVHETVAQCIADYLDLLGTSADSKETLWPSTHRKDPRTGLPRCMSTGTLGLRISGQRGMTKAFLPLPALAGSASTDPDDTVGYSPHTFRHLAEQFIYEAGSDYLRDNPDERQFITAQVIANAALDHTQSTDALGYKDLDDPAKKEHLTRIGLLGLGEYIWGDRGARQAPDVLRVEAADRAVAEAEAAIADAKRRREALRDEQRGVMHVGDRDITVADLSEADRNVRLFRAQQLSLAIDDVNDEIVRATERAGEAKLEAERARATLVPVDDFKDVSEVPAGAAPAAPIVTHVRDRVTAAEAAEAFDVSVQTMRRWFKGQMPHPAGDSRNPWDSGSAGALPDCIMDLGPRSRFLVIDRLDPRRIAPSVLVALKGG